MSDSLGLKQKAGMLLVSIGIAIIIVAMAVSAFGETTIYDFTQDGCPPCRQMQPIVEQLQAEGVMIVQLHISSPLASQLNVHATPTFVAVANGREVDRIVGATSKERLVVMVRKPIVQPKAPVKSPSPAWRYEQAKGRFGSVVRIQCQLAGRERQLGSGVLVRWGGKLIVLTARHVIHDARSISIRLATGVVVSARVISVDGVWDCAALEILDVIEGVQPALCETGNAAVLQAGDVLESCGFGSDDKLAANSGRVLGFTKANKDNDGPTDWVELSGYARQGDSGGPVFNKNGKIIGILWGCNFGKDSDGRKVPSVVVCVQAGRLHLLLNAAVEQLNRQVVYQPTGMTPPAASDGNCCPPGGDCGPAAAAGGYVLPYRNEQAAENQANSRKLDQLLNQPRQPPQIIYAAPPGSPAVVPDPSGQQALQAVGQLAGQVNAIGQKVDSLATTVDGLAKKDAPESLRERIHDRVEDAKEKVDGLIESPLARHLLFIAIGGVVIWIAISQHRKAGTKTLLERGTGFIATATAGTPIGPLTHMVDTGVEHIGQRLRDLDAKVESRFQGMQQQVTQTALQTPPPTVPIVSPRTLPTPPPSPPGALGSSGAG
jgi:S1-C subfamily serine protease